MEPKEHKNECPMNETFGDQKSPCTCPKEAIPSPYLSDGKLPDGFVDPTLKHKEFLDEIIEICHKHHHHDFFVAFSSEFSGNKEQGVEDWTAFSNKLTKPMVDYLDMISKVMFDTWTKLKKEN